MKDYIIFKFYYVSIHVKNDANWFDLYKLVAIYNMEAMQIYILFFNKLDKFFDLYFHCLLISRCSGFPT